MHQVLSTAAAAAVVAALCIQPMPAQGPHFKEGVHRYVRTVVCDDPDKALNILEAWRKHGHAAGQAMLAIYKRLMGRYGEPVCGLYSGRMVPVAQLARVPGLTFPDRPLRKMTWYVIAVGYGHRYGQQGFMLSRFPMKSKPKSEPL